MVDFCGKIPFSDGTDRASVRGKTSGNRSFFDLFPINLEKAQLPGPEAGEKSAQFTFFCTEHAKNQKNLNDFLGQKGPGGWYNKIGKP